MVSGKMVSGTFSQKCNVISREFILTVTKHLVRPAPKLAGAAGHASAVVLAIALRGMLPAGALIFND